MTCQVCSGSCTVITPKEKVTRFVQFLCDIPDRVFISTIGGIDACPTCAAEAELEYQEEMADEK